MRRQEAGGINPGYAYNTGLPVPASSNERTPTAPPACLTPNDGNARSGSRRYSRGRLISCGYDLTLGSLRAR